MKQWEMINVKRGYIVYENSFPSGLIRCYFSFEDVAPLEEYRDKEEFWKYVGSAQSIKFDLKCKETGEVVELKELMGIMYPDAEDDSHPLFMIQRLAEHSQVFVYIALGFRDPKLKGEQFTIEQLTALNEYFNNRIKTPNKKILILPESICGDPSKCKGEILTDIGLTSFENKDLSM